ncbi:MAG TPA: anti-sigma factor [Aestuariivirgaceae bacterium]|jgi:anti-sigma factor RsiW
MTTSLPKHDWILHAYFDGELEPSEKMLVEQELAKDHDARVALEAWRRQNEALQQAFGPVMSEPLPSSISAALAARPAVVRRWFVPAAAVAAVLAILAGAYVVYITLASGTAGGKVFADTALSAHVVYSAEVRHPVEVAAAEKEHLATWLSKRLGHKIEPPDLSRQGFELVGGRLLHEDRKPAAQFMYEDAGKRRLTVYVAANSTSRETSFRLQEKLGYTTCYWLDEDSGYAVVASELKSDELLPLARIIYESFEKQEG